MKKLMEILLISALASMLAVGSAFAYGTDITIFDQNWQENKNQASKVDTRTDNDGNRLYEDNEAEPGMVQSAEWDLEGFFFDDNNILSMIGTYDFVEGGKNGQLMSGDVFIDVDGDVQFGDIHGASGNRTVENTFGYDYVLDMNFDDFTYDVYELGEGSRTITSNVWANQGSNPWQYADGGTLMAENISFGYETGLTDEETGFAGEFGQHKYYSNYEYDGHRAVSGLDLNIIDPGMDSEFVVHFTMACGNDNLMGRANFASNTPGGGGGMADPSESPEPATMLLLGSGLAGLAGLRKKFGKKA